jgi:hypothetical protein
MKHVLFVLSIFLVSFTPVKTKNEIAVKNPLAITRHEIVTISNNTLMSMRNGKGEKPWIVKEKKSGVVVLSQGIDHNGDTRVDELVFEVTLGPNEEKQFVVSQGDETKSNLPARSTHSRLVPERIDDYAWENDLVAFRTYGPEAQRLVDENQKGGTLSSGLDCWLKRVNYPVIDKWYKKYVDGGTYHKDDGEGYDPYHVGASRGCGGIGVWKNDSLYVSKNFVSARKIAEGPLRNIFELTYAPWRADAAVIQEKKRITIDVGEQLYQVQEIFSNDQPIPNITVGITLHEKAGKVFVDPSKGIFSYWETIDDSELGTGVVINPADMITYSDFRTTKKDLSQLYVIAKPKSGLTYYTGYGWKKAGSIQTANDWVDYLSTFSKRMTSPLIVTIK